MEHLFQGVELLYVSSLTKYRFAAREVPFRRPQKYTLTAAEVRFAYSILGNLKTNIVLSTSEHSPRTSRGLYSFIASIVFVRRMFIPGKTVNFKRFRFRYRFRYLTLNFQLSTFNSKRPSPSFLTSNRPQCRCTGRFGDERDRLYPSHIPLIFCKRIRSDALQAFLKVLTFAYSFFYLIMQYELQCIKFPQ